MASITNFPNGFATGLTVRNVPLLSAYPGNVFWVCSAAAQVGSKGTFSAPYATIATALAQCVSNNGDIIVCKPQHAETITDATSFALSTAGVAVIGLGTGSNRPTFTYTTANTATMLISADNVTIQNCRFSAGFLSIAAAITLTTAKNVTIQNCSFVDQSTVLNFLNIVKSTGGANTVDGFAFQQNFVKNLGVTANNTTFLSANAVTKLFFQDNYINFAVQNDVAMGIILTTGVILDAVVSGNWCYRPNTSTNGGSLINVGGTTSTGIVANNFVQTLDTSADIIFTTTSGLGAFQNFVSGVVGASGFLIPTADS